MASIVDAVHAGPDERTSIEAVARSRRVPFEGIWLALPAEERVRRVALRKDDASDAGPDIAAAQEQVDTGSIAWARLDAGRPADEIAAEIVGILGDR